MPRPKKEVPGIQFVDELPGKGGSGKWVDKLAVLLDHPHRWALVAETASPQQAQDVQSNLSQRKVRIPLPEAEWEFAARGSDVFAKYLGPAARTSRRKAKV